MSDGRINGAATSIRATAKHDVPPGVFAELEDELKFFLDIDLSILGQSEDVFDNYEKAIRAEYSFVEFEFYKSARANILENFLARRRIYFKDALRDLWESRARKNPKRAIEQLS